jgi:hypothetical protein
MPGLPVVAGGYPRDAPGKIYTIPSQPVLLAQSQSCVEGEIKFWKMMWKFLRNCISHVGLVFGQQTEQSAITFSPLTHETRRIGRTNPLFIPRRYGERKQCSISVERRWFAL